MILVYLFAAILAFGTPILAVIAFLSSQKLETEVWRLRMRLAAAETELATLRQPASLASSPVVAVEAEPEPEPKPTPGPETIVVPPPLPRPAAIPMAPEGMLAERWLVWLGGIALALGGAFLVKFSVEEGWLGPAVRVSLGAAMGMGAVVLGHWLSRPAHRLGSLPWHLPPVLVGAGASMVFASIYAAYGLYDLLNPMVAFAALAATAAATVLLSLGHGPIVALIGLTGAFAVPLLVRSPEPNAVGLFAYLLVLAAGAMALVRWREWWWLAWVTLGGAAGWTLLWLLTAYRSGDEIVLGLFLCALMGLFAALRLGIPAIAAFARPAEAPMRVVAVAAATIAAVALPVIHAAGFSGAALTLLFVLNLGYLALGRRDQELDLLPVVGAVLTLAVLAGWDVGVPPTPYFVEVFHPPLTVQAVRLAWVAVLSGILFGGVGFGVATRSRRPIRWAALSAATPLAILAVAYGRLFPSGPDWAWTACALTLAAVLLAAAEQINRRRNESGFEAVLGAYAVGVVGALALAATFALEKAWLTVALSLVLPGAAWVDARLRVEGLRWVSLGLAAVVLVRLGLNPYVLDYPIGVEPVFNWLLYAYGIPLLAFAASARSFRHGADDVLVEVLEGGAIVFGVLLVSLEIHHLMAGSLSLTSGYPLVERSIQTVSWLIEAAILFQLHRRSGRFVPLRGGQILMALATAQAVLLQALFGNPLLTGAPVGENVVANPLLIAFAAPAALYALHARRAGRRPPWDKPAYIALALVFAFLWATLEVRHAFSGGNLQRGVVGQAELWAYSAVYLVGGVAVLGSGIRWGSTELRRTGLAVVMLVVAKVFLIDLSEATGIWRAMSFLCLGATLVGIGWLYRRFVPRGGVNAAPPPGAGGR